MSSGREPDQVVISKKKVGNPDHTPEGMWPKRVWREVPRLGRSRWGIPEEQGGRFRSVLEGSGGQVGVPLGRRRIGVAESLKRRVRRVRRLSSWREEVRSGPKSRKSAGLPEFQVCGCSGTRI